MENGGTRGDLTKEVDVCSRGCIRPFDVSFLPSVDIDKKDDGDGGNNVRSNNVGWYAGRDAVLESFR